MYQKNRFYIKKLIKGVNNTKEALLQNIYFPFKYYAKFYIHCIYNFF